MLLHLFQVPVVTKVKKNCLKSCGNTWLYTSNTKVIPTWCYISLDVVRQHRLRSSSTSHRRVAEPQLQDRLPIEIFAGTLLTSSGKPHSLYVSGEGMLRPQQPPPFVRTSPLAARACGGEFFCSDFNYKPQTESRQQHLALHYNGGARLCVITFACWHLIHV